MYYFDGGYFFFSIKTMNNNCLLYLLITSIFISCCLSNEQKNDRLPFIDIRKNYPEKEIVLTDIADISYVHLNTINDEYIYKGTISNVTKNSIVVYDEYSRSILFFSKDGNPKSRFNRFGQGAEEYLNAERIFYDEEKDEVFVGDIIKSVLVYSSKGDFKRKINLPLNTSTFSMVSFDDQSFYVYTKKTKTDMKEHKYITFYQISKEDGAILDSLKLLINEVEVLFKSDQGITLEPSFIRMMKCVDGVFLHNPENDTIFLYAQNKSLTPVLYQIPRMQDTEPKVYMQNCCEIGGYKFFEATTLSFDLNSNPPKKPAVKHYVLDKTNQIFRQKIVLPDFKDKEFFIQAGAIYRNNVSNGSFFELDLIELKQAYREDKLSGKLKELVATLNEDEDNNVFILVEFK